VSVVPESRQARKQRLRDRRQEWGAALRAAAETEAEAFPADWTRAQFVVEIERGADGPVVQVVFYEVVGDSFERAGGVCG
jgi:hypothetical protein